MEEEQLIGDNLYVQRLLWQQMRSPRVVKLTPTKDDKEEVDENRNNVDSKHQMEIDEGLENNSEIEESEQCSKVRCTLSNSEKTEGTKHVRSLFFDGKENGSFSSTPRSKTTVYFPSDRYIPKREIEGWQTKFDILSGIGNTIERSPTKKKEPTPSTNPPPNSNSNLNNTGNTGESRTSESLGYTGQAYHSLLQNELLGQATSAPLPSLLDTAKGQQGEANGSGSERRTEMIYVANGDCSPRQKAASNYNLFHYKRKVDWAENAGVTSPYSLTPVGARSQKLLSSPRKPPRKIPRIPFKVLDAPELQDDFYLNLVDWSAQNVLAVGLGNSVYLWSASTSQVTRLCDFLSENNAVTSVGWNERGNYVAVGTHQGYIQIWDVAVNKMVVKLTGHTARVGVLAWNGENLSSGSRDRMIFQNDIRCNTGGPDRRLVGHRQEVCGLKWSPDNQHLASGGNDNRLYVWNHSSNVPIQTYSDHLAAVKAIAWSPHQHGLLASGGGTADRCIRFWNTLTGQAMQWVDTGSQVCNLAWSKHSSELVSTHGYSQNQILVWKYPSLTQVAKLTGHSYRVLYLAMSPDGESIVTGAGDETLRFWNIFSKARSQKECRGSLNLFSHIR